MDITDRLRRPLVSHAKPEDMPNRELARMLVDDRSDALIEITKLRYPFRNADALDWEHLFKMLPNSGHGQFWKAVLAEMKTALDDKQQ